MRWRAARSILLPSTDSESGICRDTAQKVNAICDLLRAEIEQRDAVHYANTILTAHVRKKPPDHESALKVLTELKGLLPKCPVSEILTERFAPRSQGRREGRRGRQVHHLPERRQQALRRCIGHVRLFTRLAYRSTVSKSKSCRPWTLSDPGSPWPLDRIHANTSPSSASYGSWTPTCNGIELTTTSSDTTAHCATSSKRDLSTTRPCWLIQKSMRCTRRPSVLSRTMRSDTK